MPNETTLKAMGKAEKGEDVYGAFNSVEELLEALDANDYGQNQFTRDYYRIEPAVHTSSFLC